MPVRSTLLGWEDNATGSFNVFTTPADRTAVIKQVSIAVPPASTVDLAIQVPGGAVVLIERVSNASPTATVVSSLNGRFHVLPPAHQLIGTCSVGACDVAASGALLVGAPS